jgi:hypothetical protein
MAGWAAGANRQSRRIRRAALAGRNEEEEPSAARLAARRGGTRGSDAHPARSSAGAQRRRARAASAASHRVAVPGAEGAHRSSTLESGWPSRWRARAPVGQPQPCLPAGSSVPREKRKAPRTLAASQKSARARPLEIAFRCRRQPSRVSDRHPDGPRREATRRRDQRRRARSRAARDALRFRFANLELRSGHVYSEPRRRAPDQTPRQHCDNSEPAHPCRGSATAPHSMQGDTNADRHP